MSTSVRMPTLTLQKALLARLQADLTIDVYDEVPEETAVDYVVIGDFNVTGDDTKTIPGVTATAIIEVWSNHRGAKEVHQNVDLVIQSATRRPFFSLEDGFRIWDARFDNFEARRGVSRTTEDPVRVGVIRIAYRIQDG